jgi:DNA invertase Pin-like site-specific DNA recombinase
MPDLRKPLWWNGCTDAISYKRFSSGRQASGNSIARQADLEADYAGEFGLQIIDSFTDAGLSAHDGANSDLGDLRRLLDAAKVGRFRSGTHLLVESFDRLSRREARKAHRLFDDLIDTGLYIHTLGDEQVYWAASLDNDPTRIIISIVIMIRSHDESATKRRRSNANRRIERERAMTSATASENHVGVPITKLRPAWINIIINKDHERAAYREWHFELDPIKSAGVGQIWEYAAAGWGVIQIASSLNEQKLPTFSGAAVWTRGMVQNIVSNDAVIGLHQPMRYEKDRNITGSKAKRGKPVPIGEPFLYYPAAITVELYRGAKATMANNHKGGRGRHGPTYSNLLKGLCECGLCGNRVHHLDRSGPHTYLQCKAATVRACSNKVMFPYHRLEPLLYRLHEVYRAIADMLPTPVSDHAEKIAVLENEIERWRHGRQRLYERYANGQDDPDLDLTLNRLDEQIEQAGRQLDGLRERDRLAQHQSDQNHVDRFFDARQLIESADPQIRLGARMQVASEYRRIIETVILNPDRSLTVKIKRRAGDGIQVCYSLTSERIEKWWVVRPDGVELAPRDLFFDSSIPIEQIAEHAARHVRAKSDDLYASNG